MGFKKSKQMKKQLIFLLILFSCTNNGKDKVIQLCKQKCLNSFTNYEISKRGESYILRTDTLNFKVLPNYSVEPISTMSGKALKRGILNDIVKEKIKVLVKYIKSENIYSIERNEDYFEIFQSDSSEPLIVKIH
jgi:hypothetical protein